MDLSEIAIFFRKSLIWLVLGTTFLLVVLLLTKILADYWQNLNPTEPAVTQLFGELPILNIKGKALDLSKTQIDLDTVDLALPKLASVLEVYPFNKANPSLLDLERAKGLALNFGFKDEPQALNERTYRWVVSTGSKTLTADIVTKNFTFQYDYQKDDGALKTDSPLNLETGATRAKEILKGKGLLPSDLEGGQLKVRPVLVSKTEIKNVSSLSEANGLEVKIFRAPIDLGKRGKITILGPTPQDSPVSMLLSFSSDSNKRLLYLNYNYFPINLSNPSTYNVKLIDEAWEEFQNSVSTFVGEIDILASIKVKEIYLSYYDSYEVQDFLQPIFVFSGYAQNYSGKEIDFVAYLPAVSISYETQ